MLGVERMEMREMVCPDKSFNLREASNKIYLSSYLGFCEAICVEIHVDVERSFKRE